MTREELRGIIAQNLTNLQVEQIRVQPDPFAGWRALVVSSDFEGKSLHERASLAFAGIKTAEIQ